MITINIETLAEFEARHSVDGYGKINDVRNFKFIYSDGAWHPDDLPHDPVAAQSYLHEPADEIEQRLKDRKRYFTLALQAAEGEFNGLRSNLADCAFMAAKYCNLPVPPADGKAALLHARQVVFTLREKLAEVENEINQTPAALRRQAILDDQALRSRQASQLGAEFMGVTL